MNLSTRNYNTYLTTYSSTQPHGINNVHMDTYSCLYIVHCIPPPSLLNRADSLRLGGSTSAQGSIDVRVSI